MATSVGLVEADAWAAPANDGAVSAQVSQVLAEDYAQASFGEARRKLLAALEKCKKGGCSGPVRAQANIVLGMVHSQLGQADDAKAAFNQALTDDPNAKLPATTTPNIRGQWKEVQDKIAASKPPPPPPPEEKEPPPPPVTTVGPPPAASGPTAPTEAPPPEATPEQAGTPVAGSKIPGWANADAYLAAMAGLAAGTAGKYDECIKHDKESLDLEDKPRTRLHLASCEAKAQKLIDALRDASKAYDAGKRARDAGVLKVADQMIRELVPRIPHVTFMPPPNAEDLQVSFDDHPVPTESLTKKFSIDPGKHVVHAEALVNGIPMAFDKEYTVKAGELLTVPLILESPQPQYLTPGQLRCMLSAKNQEEVNKCFPQNHKNLVTRIDVETSGYSDSFAVNVFSPRISASITSPTAGWNVGAGYLVDVFSAASPDIVSYASRKYNETRHAVSVHGGYKPGLYGVNANANVSREPDYLSLTAGVSATADLRDKLVTPRIGISYSHDTIGFKSTPFSAFSRNLDTTSIEAGVTLVLSATAVLFLNATLQFERGDQSKPYRFMPFFDPAKAALVPAGAVIDLVNRERLPIRANEQLPTEKDRYALAARIAKRFSNSTLRLEERVYTDTWGTKATTTDGRLIFDVGKSFRVWPHLRINANTGVNFYRLAYPAAVDDQGNIVLPLFRTGDRELSPMATATAGGGTRWNISPPEAKTQFALTLQGDFMYSYYFNLLYVKQRTAIYGSLGMEVEFE